MFQNALPRRSPSRTTVGSRPSSSSTTPSSSSASSSGSSNPDTEKEKMKSAKFEHLLRHELLAKIEKDRNLLTNTKWKTFPQVYFWKRIENPATPASFYFLSVYATQLNLYSTNKIKSLFPVILQKIMQICSCQFLPTSEFLVSVQSAWASLRSWPGQGFPAATGGGCGRSCAATSPPWGARRWSGGSGRSTPDTWTSTSTTRRRTSTRTPSGETSGTLSSILPKLSFYI